MKLAFVLKASALSRSPIALKAPKITLNFFGITKFPIKSNILGNTEAFKEAGDVLVRRLPWKPSRSNHRLIVHWLRLTAEDGKEKKTT